MAHNRFFTDHTSRLNMKEMKPFFLLIAVAVWFGLRYARQKGYSFLQLGLWCFVFMMLGYSTYVTTLVRSNANPGIDMNNVDNPMSLNYYLGREQYGSQPLLYGPHFQAEYERDETFLSLDCRSSMVWFAFRRPI